MPQGLLEPPLFPVGLDSPRHLRGVDIRLPFADCPHRGRLVPSLAPRKYLARLLAEVLNHPVAPGLVAPEGRLPFQVPQLPIGLIRPLLEGIKGGIPEALP